MDGEGKTGGWFEKRWGWIATIDSVATDRKDWDYYMEMSAMEFLNYLAFLKDKAKHTEQKQDEEKRKSKLRK